MNLPVVPITDLVLENQDLIVATQGRSFWILDDLTPLHQLTPKISKQSVHLYKPGDTFRMRGGRWRSSGGSLGQNPPAGVVVQYYFKETPEEEVTLEFRERNGNVIKTFTSKQKENIASQSILGRGDRGVQHAD